MSIQSLASGEMVASENESHDLQMRVALHTLQAPANDDCPTAGFVLKTETNLLYMSQLEELKRYSWINQLAMIASLIYVATIATLAFLNILRTYYHIYGLPKSLEKTACAVCGPWVESFHMLEFWANFLFNVTTAFVLMNSTSITFHELALRWRTIYFSLFDIVSSFAAACLATIDLHYFEPYCHNIEYTTLIFVMLVDYMLFLSLSQSPSSSRVRKLQLSILLSIGFTMLIVYNTLPAPWNEYVAHYFEFPVDIGSGLVVFYTSAENKRQADREIFTLMYKPCDVDCADDNPADTASSRCSIGSITGMQGQGNKNEYIPCGIEGRSCDEPSEKSQYTV